MVNKAKEMGKTAKRKEADEKKKDDDAREKNDEGYDEEIKPAHAQLPTWVKIRQITTLNTLRYWMMLAVCFALAIHYKSFLVFVLSYIGIFGFIEFLFYFKGISVFDSEISVSSGYDFSTFMITKPHSQGLDYGFNLYNGDYNKTTLEAQKDKFDFAWDHIGLESGMSVCDVGCGNGDWLLYLKNRDIKVSGINICKAQVAECHSRGLTGVVHTNYKDVEHSDALRKTFYGTCDAVTYWDTIEHYVSARDSNNLEKSDAIYQGVFRLACNMFKPDSKLKRVWNSCLHCRSELSHLRSSPVQMIKHCINKPLIVFKLFVMYILDRVHSGSYPNGIRDSLTVAANKENMELTFRKDCTTDYMMTSNIDPHHFGRHYVKWDLDKAILVVAIMITSPYWWHIHIWYIFQIWMYQFDEKNISESPFVLWWSIWEKKEKQIK